MRLSWNEIRARAGSFARKWAAAGYEKGETQSFYNDFFRIFGVRRESVARYEERVEKLDDTSGFIDLFWPGVLIVEQKSAGRDLSAAYEQAGGYFDALAESERTRYILVSDFQHFELHDLLQRDEVSFRLDQLPEHVEKFGFILGVASRTFRDQDPANIEAAELVGKLHDSLRDAGYPAHDLERFLVRIVFCLFADDTGVFEPRDILLDFLETRTREDGTDLGPLLAQLFQVLDTPEGQRIATLDEDLARFPYIDGDLFADTIRIPAFSAEMREHLLVACRFNWSTISPAIFGSLFQSVMEPEERRAQGAHYTTEQNILKVIEPLFLDDLWEEFTRIKALRRGRKPRLQEFQRRLGDLKFFDPACGCGNFLVIAYRELRRLELEVIREILEYERDETGTIAARLDVGSLSRLDVDQFYGIEIGEFPARIAEVALWMTDHLMNNELSLEFGQSYARIPLKRSPHIHCADALEMDWEDLLPAKECSFVFGNPPFGGAKFQSPRQRAQVRRIAALGGTGGTLDYVTAWFITAGRYIQESGSPGERARIGFVATNSITQGEQVAQLWPILFGRCGLEIAFAHRTFVWGSDAPGMAHVHVVIVGLDDREGVPSERRLFSYDDAKGDPHESAHAVLSPYLFDAGGLSDPHLVVREEGRPINGLPQLLSGSQPIDGGNTIFRSAEATAFLADEPAAAPYLRPYVGAREHLQGGDRYILALHDVSPHVLRQMPLVRARLRAVQNYRRKSKRSSTLQLAETPTLWQVNVVPSAPFLVVPETSSERREYAPIAWLSPPVVPSNALKVLLGVTRPVFALLTSSMHMAWLRHIGGRLKSDYRYSIGSVYNTFPLPPKDADLAPLDPLAQVVLDARSLHPEATLADLYDPDLMPVDLRRAHRALDRAVDRLYRPRKFSSERERVEHLFMLYERMRTPLVAATKKQRRRRTVRISRR
ncbi:MAG: class I SAM-dependent DNA methyltransferase [Acidobacteria bacterium]|nr:class I SAM-dependent DNA methyltransferase [Acidobacteriota bacterium]MYF13392.1 class I SAM-dependent DNA methyltransferase [Acidobacteriota bacterium]MYI95687.1 class I SAM-dependent DNA methyltransferase [Acidobacteriota bacterium]